MPTAPTVGYLVHVALDPLRVEISDETVPVLVGVVVQHLPSIQSEMNPTVCNPFVRGQHVNCWQCPHEMNGPSGHPTKGLEHLL